ncbi:MAG: hypothetical protein KC420_10565, partial [Myxococcales bacterium]|nr:hypothetical protein [Myxococcales bacterium]
PPAPPPPPAPAAAPAPDAPVRRRRADKDPKSGKPSESGGYAEIESSDDDLPEPGDRDYF